MSVSIAVNPQHNRPATEQPSALSKVGKGFCGALKCAGTTLGVALLAAAGAGVVASGFVLASLLIKAGELALNKMGVQVEPLDILTLVRGGALIGGIVGAFSMITAPFTNRDRTFY